MTLLEEIKRQINYMKIKNQNNFSEEALEVSDLVMRVRVEGYKVIYTPKTVFVPWGLESWQIPDDIKRLRDDYGFMIQTEIS